jgi:predicted enzyme related to lactoylglutathione lyase
MKNAEPHRLGFFPNFSAREVAMTVADSTLLGRPLWFELMTTDMKAAETFYRTVVGWSAMPFDGSPQPYTMFTRSGEIPVAGVMTKPAEVPAPPFWAMYVAVPKLEDAAAHITRLGGRAHSEVIDVPTVGRMQMMADPQGAAFYIYEPASSEQLPEGAPEVGEASWLELMTTDAPAALAFYQEIFGWQPSEAMDMGAMGKYHMFNRPHGMIGGMMNKGPQMAHVPPNWQIYFRVPDINAATERIKANGGQIFNGPMEVPGGDWIVNGMDPQGAAFSLHAKPA